MKIVVTGNCQSTALACMLAKRTSTQAGEHEVITCSELHLIREDDLPELFYHLSTADVALATPVKSNYRTMPIGTDQLSEKCRAACQFIVYPNMYFKGYHPHFGFIRDEDGNHLTQDSHAFIGFSPFGNIHDYFALSFYLSELAPLDTVVQRYKAYLVSIRKLLETSYKVALQNSLIEAEKRESACTVTISSQIRQTYANIKLFHSFNHPANFLISSVADMIISQIGLEPAIIENSDNDPRHELLSSPSLPILPSVASSIGINFDIESNLSIDKVYADYFHFLSLNKELVGSCRERMIDLNAIINMQ